MEQFSAPGNILCGLATASGGTIITVPAGRIWIGTVTISASAIVASGGAAVTASARVSVLGAGANPPAGDYVRLDLVSPASLLAAIGTGCNSSISAPLIVAAPVGNSVELRLNSTNCAAQSASACGVLRFAHGAT